MDYIALPARKRRRRTASAVEDGTTAAAAAVAAAEALRAALLLHDSAPIEPLPVVDQDQGADPTVEVSKEEKAPPHATVRADPSVSRDEQDLPMAAAPTPTRDEQDPPMATAPTPTREDPPMAPTPATQLVYPGDNLDRLSEAQRNPTMAPSVPRVDMVSTRLDGVLVGTWLPCCACVLVCERKGKALTIAGVPLSGEQVCLPVEDMVFFLERGSLEVLYQDRPLSIQEGYALLGAGRVAPCATHPDIPMFAPLATPMATYEGFASLRRDGYIVRRRAQYGAQWLTPLDPTVGVPPTRVQQSSVLRRGQRNAGKPKDEVGKARHQVSQLREAKVMARLQSIVQEYQGAVTAQGSLPDIYYIWLPGAVASFRLREPKTPPAFALCMGGHADRALPPSSDLPLYHQVKRAVHPLPLRFAATKHAKVFFNDFKLVSLPQLNQE